MKPSAGKTAAEIVHELIDKLLRRDFDGSVETLLEQRDAGARGRARGGRRGRARPSRARRELAGGDRPARRPTSADEIPGLGAAGHRRRGGRVALGADGRPRPAVQWRRTASATRPTRATRHLRDPELVLRHARELVLRLREGVPAHAGAPGTAVLARPWTEEAPGPLALEATVDA